MSSATIASIRLIVLISNIVFLHQTTAVSQCELSSAIHLQSVTYTHSLIVRVQPIVSSELDWTADSPARLIPLRKVLVREVIKYPLGEPREHQQQIRMNDLIIIRIKDDHQEDFLDDSCWQLLRISTIDVILFLNQTSIDEFDLYHPPVESTFRVRQNIDAVLHHETYPPQVLIKTRLEPAILSREYSLQCYSRGNPLPRLLWSKKIDSNQTLEYFPLAKQCRTPCRIHAVQNRYQSTLFFQSLILDDIGIYVCHAENPMNRTSSSVYLDIDRSITNVTCASLQFCHHRGQCILIDQHLKCLCDNRYFGEHCETNYDDIVKKQDNAILLFKSRFLAGCILVLIGFLLLLIALLSWFLARNNRRQQQQRNKVKQPPASAKPLIPPTKEKVRPAETSNGRLPAPPAIEPIAKSSTPPPSTLPAATLIRLSNSPTPEKRSLTPPDNIGKRNHPASFTRESSTATDDDDEPGYTSFLRHHQTLPSVPHETDEEYEERFSLQMNKSEEHGLGYLTNGFQINHVPNTDNHPTLYPFEHRTGLIKPLNIGADAPQRYTKYVSSYSKFVLPRPVQSANEYPQR